MQRPELLLDSLIAHLRDTAVEHETGRTFAENHGATSGYAYHRHATEQFLGIEAMGELVVADDILQTVCLTADDGHSSADGDIAQIIVLHLHTNGACIADGHHPLDGLEAYATDSHPRTLCPAGNHEVASLIAHTTTYINRIGWGKESDVGVCNRLAICPHDSSYQLRAVFLDAFHEDVAPLDIDSDGIESTDFADGIGQVAAALYGLGHSEVLEFIVDEGNVVML